MFINFLQHFQKLTPGIGFYKIPNLNEKVGQA